MTRLKRKKEIAGTTTHENDLRFGTPAMVAQYRAKRLAKLKPDTIIEVGAGAGFQTGYFSKIAKRVIAIDVDAERLSRAKFDSNVTILAGDALDKAILEKIKSLVEGKAVVFLDPERPPSSKHRTIDEIKPDILQFLSAYSAITPDIAIELPPFTSEIPFPCEREYLSVDYQLNRLTIYCGALKECAVSAVQLPGEHRATSPIAEPASVRLSTQHFLLEPDLALAQAGLVYTELDVPYEEISLGKRNAYLTTAETKSSFFKKYRLLALGKQQVKHSLRQCSILILHGSMEEQEQQKLLRELRPFCLGKDRLHLFVGKEGSQWWLAKHKA